MADWISPTGHNDPDDKWDDETNAYDDNLGTRCLTSGTYNANVWCEFLELTHAAINATKIRFYMAFWEATREWDFDVYKDGAWVDVFQGAAGGQSNYWWEHSFPEGSVTKLRFRSRHTTLGGTRPTLYEADFYGTAGVAYSKSIAEKIGFVDSHSKVQHHKKTVSEKMGFVDEHDKDKCKKCKPSSVILTF
jgi:hypothetical protein